MRTLYSGLLLTTFTLAGCTSVGPDYISPQPTFPTDWTEQSSSGTEADDPSVLQSWSESFHDPMLDCLVAQAIANNYDLRIAQRLLAARAERDSIASAHYVSRGFEANLAARRGCALTRMCTRRPRTGSKDERDDKAPAAGAAFVFSVQQFVRLTPTPM